MSKTNQLSQDEHTPYITVTQGLRGYFAVMVWWNAEEDDCAPFWEPWQSSPCSFNKREQAVEDAKFWAEAEGIAYKE